MSEQHLSLDQQIANVEANIRLIEERKSEYVESTAIPLDLIRDERTQQARLQQLFTLREQLRKVDCPYRGLEIFKEEHSAYFHGRSALVAQLVNKLRLASFVTVIGVSGSGKSSLVRAGLIPALRGGAFTGSSAWQIAVLRPGADPLTSLCASLVNFLNPELVDSAAMAETRNLADSLLTGKLVMSRDILPRLAQQSTAPQLLIVIDQFEEVFDPQVDPRIREQFINSITDTSAADWLRIVVTLRANYFDAALQQPSLREKVAAGQFTVLPMNEAERRDAIMLPAINAGRSFEPGLVDRILEDLSAAAGELPLLEFAMTQLWQRQSAAGVLTHAAYEEIGAVGGAIARHASEIYTSASQEQQRQIQQLCKRLVRIDADEQAAERLIAEANVRRINLDDLDASMQDLVYEVLADQRLVTIGRNESTSTETVELVHEALIRSWPQLSQWLIEDVPNLRMQQSLAEAVQIWERFARSPELLYSGRRLRDISSWLYTGQAMLTARETEFLNLSVAARTRRRWLMAAGALALLVVVGGLIAALVIRSSPDQPTSMPPNHFNIAVADFAIQAPAGATAAMTDDLQRDADSFARQIVEDLQAQTQSLKEDVFGDDITIWGASQFSIDTTDPISVQQSLKDKNINLLLYGEIAPDVGRYWQIQPYFVVNDAVFSDRVSEVLGSDQVGLGAPIPYIVANQQSIQDAENEIRERLQTLGQLLSGLTQYDLGSETGYRKAREIFCANKLHIPVDEQQEGADMLLLFCGHANNMLAATVGRSSAEYTKLLSESQAAYHLGLDLKPGDPRLQISMASSLLTASTPLGFDCAEVNTDRLDEAQTMTSDFLAAHGQDDDLPLTTRIESNVISGRVFFWHGLCIDFEQHEKHWNEAETAYRTAGDLAQEAGIDSLYAQRAAGKAEFFRGHLEMMRFALSQDPQSAEQHRIEASNAYSNSIVTFLNVADSESLDNAVGATAYSLLMNCQTGHQTDAATLLTDVLTQVPDPKHFREQVFAWFPEFDLQKGCGL